METKESLAQADTMLRHLLTSQSTLLRVDVGAGNSEKGKAAAEFCISFTARYAEYLQKRDAPQP